MQVENVQVRPPRAHRYYVAVLVVALVYSGLLATYAHGVVISEGDGSGNTSAPADDPGIANVGERGAASAVYLGNRWVLTAAHVKAGSVTFAGETYVIEPDTVHRIENGPGLSDRTDIVIFRVEKEPPLPALHLACQSVSVGQEVVMVGRGRNRLPKPTFWDVTKVAGKDNDIWEVIDASSPDADKKGYQTNSSKEIRWGRNIVSLTEVEIEVGFGDVLSFQTSFDSEGELGRTEFEAQGVAGDSGGAVFAKTGSVWELVGMIHAVDIEDNQPGGSQTAVYGNETFIADLFRYADQLRAIADFEPAAGDFDGDGEFTNLDIDLLMEEIRLGHEVCHFDVDADARVSTADVDFWLADIAGSLWGDANLDGQVTFTDFLMLSDHFDEAGGWGEGDFTGDGKVGFDDFLLLSSNFDMDSEDLAKTAAAAVPEPASVALILASLLVLPAFRRARLLPSPIGLVHEYQPERSQECEGCRLYTSVLS